MASKQTQSARLDSLEAALGHMGSLLETLAGAHGVGPAAPAAPATKAQPTKASPAPAKAAKATVAFYKQGVTAKKGATYHTYRVSVPGYRDGFVTLYPDDGPGRVAGGERNVQPL